VGDGSGSGVNVAEGMRVGIMKVGVAVSTAWVRVGVGSGLVLIQPERAKAVAKIEAATLATFARDRKPEEGWGYLVREVPGYLIIKKKLFSFQPHLIS
jgi:hypothetical protein